MTFLGLVPLLQKVREYMKKWERSDGGLLLNSASFFQAEMIKYVARKPRAD